MGAIFEAVHTATERRVALKLLFPHIMSVASARRKFELEAKISARVNSPFIVEVLDAGFDEATKSPFLVMELLEGQTLAAFVRSRGPLAVDEALQLLEQLAAGLDAAHKYKEGGVSRPIVHRDLKPENLFLSHEDDLIVLKILDFGIAKVLGESCNVSQEVRGTPLYMAFEQVTAGVLSPQTDVWALGLIAYFMLTGQSYWRSASEPSANVQSLFAEILNLPLVAPTVRAAQQGSNVVLPPELDAWLLTCLEREPARRYASAGAAVEAFARALGRTPRPRPRFSSMPAPALAATAPDTTPEPTPLPPIAIPVTPQPARVAAALPPPTPELAAAPVTMAPGPERSLAAPGAASSATGSLPAIASERFATPTPSRGPSRQRVASAGVAAALLASSLLWIAAGGRSASDASAGASGAAAAPTLPVRAEALQLSPAPATPLRSAVVLGPDEPFSTTPTSDTPNAAEPAAPALGTALAGETPELPGASLEAAPEEPSTELPPPEPRIRVALPDEIAASEALDPTVVPVIAEPEVAPASAPEPAEPTVGIAAPPPAPSPPAVIADKPPAASAGKPAVPRRKTYDSAYDTR